MNQTTNIDEVHNTREFEELEVLLIDLLNQYNLHDAYRRNLPRTPITTVKGRKIKEYIHHQLQKARQDERERIATDLDRYAHESHSATINIKHLMEKLVDHSELDQHINSIFKE